MFLFYTNPDPHCRAAVPGHLPCSSTSTGPQAGEKSLRRCFHLAVLYGIAATFIALVLERAKLSARAVVRGGSVAYNAIMYFGIVAFSRGARSISCSAAGRGTPPLSTASLTAWCTRCSFRSASRCGENISYVLMYGLSTALVRAVTACRATPASAFSWAWYGLAKRLHGQGRHSASKLCRVLALLLPALLHGCYDFIASIESVHYGWLFAAFKAILFVLAFGGAVRRRPSDRYISNYDAGNICKNRAKTRCRRQQGLLSDRRSSERRLQRRSPPASSRCPSPFMKRTASTNLTEPPLLRGAGDILLDGHGAVA